MIKPASASASTAFLIIGLIIAWGSWYTIPEGYRGVVTRNGAVVDEATPGLHFKTPIIDGVTEMSIKQEKTEFQQLQAYSSDAQTASVNISVNTHLLADHVRDVYSTVGADYNEKLLSPIVPQHLKEVFGQNEAIDVIRKREQIGAAVLKALQEDMIKHGIIVDSVQIENIDFSDAYEKAAEAAATAQAAVREAQQKLEQAKVNAQQRVAEAEADAQATRAKADAEAYATTQRGNAEALAIAARGKALRDNPDVVSLTTAEKWNGVLPAQMVPGSAVPFLSLQK